MFSRARLSLASLVLLGILPQGCRSPVDSGQVQREWTGTLRELGINPIYPPREDVQVGDVYARRGHPAATDLFPDRGYVPIDLWLASIDVRDGLRTFYGRRSEHASTLVARPAGDPTADLPFADVPSVASGDSFTNSSILRLRQVAFPDFMGMSISGGDLRGLVPVEAVQLAFGANWNREHQVVVKIPSAESCGLPLRLALDKILAPIPDTDRYVLQPSIATPAQLLLLYEGQRNWIETTPELGKKARAELLANKYVYLDVITEVYYARTIDIGILSRQSMGGTAAVQPPGMTARALGPDAGEPVPPRSESGTGDGQGVLSEEDLHALGAVALADRMNQELAEIGAQTLPGGSFRFLSAAAGSVSMRRTYAHPIAIGYRSLLVAVKPQTGEIAGMGGRSGGLADTTAGTPDQVATRIGDAVEAWFAETHTIEYMFTARPSGEQVVIRYRPSGDDELETIETEIRANREAIVDHIDWGNWEGEPRDDPLVKKFLNDEFRLEKVD